MRKLFNEWKWTILGLSVVLVVAFVLRSYNLGSLPIFADEAIYIRWSQVMKSESTLRFLPLSDGKQPLQMWVMIPFLKFINDPLIAGRILSSFTGLGTLIGIFVASYLLFNSKKVSLAASAFYSLVPFSVFFDRMALADSMLMMFGIWVFCGGLLLSKTLRLDVSMITGFLLGGALLTKSPALYFSLLLPTLAILSKSKREALKYIFLLIPTYIIGYGIYNILRLGPNFHLLALRNMDYVYPVSHLFSSPLDPFKPFVDRAKEFYLMMGTVGLSLLFLVGIFTELKNSWKEKVILLAWFLGPILISSEFSKTMTARYVLFSLPFFVILSAASLFRNKGLINNILLVFALLFLGQSIAIDFKLLTNPEEAYLPRSERSGYLEEWTAGQGIRETADYINYVKLNSPNKNIVVGTEGYFGTLPDGLQIYFDKDNNVNVIGVGLELDKIPNSLIEAKKAGNLVYLLANNERMNTDYNFINLKLVKEFKKAVRPNGSTQSLLLLEVTNEAVNKK